MVRGGDAFNRKKVVEGEITAGLSGAIGNNGVIKDV